MSSVSCTLEPAMSTDVKGSTVARACSIVEKDFSGFMTRPFVKTGDVERTGRIEVVEPLC